MACVDPVDDLRLFAPSSYIHWWFEAGRSAHGGQIDASRGTAYQKSDYSHRWMWHFTPIPSKMDIMTHVRHASSLSFLLSNFLQHLVEILHTIRENASSRLVKDVTT